MQCCNNFEFYALDSVSRFAEYCRDPSEYHPGITRADLSVENQFAKASLMSDLPMVDVALDIAMSEAKVAVVLRFSGAGTAGTFLFTKDEYVKAVPHDFVYTRAGDQFISSQDSDVEVEDLLEGLYVDDDRTEIVNQRFLQLREQMESDDDDDDDDDNEEQFGITFQKSTGKVFIEKLLEGEIIRTEHPELAAFFSNSGSEAYESEMIRLVNSICHCYELAPTRATLYDDLISFWCVENIDFSPIVQKRRVLENAAADIFQGEWTGFSVESFLPQGVSGDFSFNFLEYMDDDDIREYLQDDDGIEYDELVETALGLRPPRMTLNHAREDIIGDTAPAY